MFRSTQETLAHLGCLSAMLLWPAWGLHSCVKLAREAPGKWWLVTPVAFALLVFLWWPLGVAMVGVGLPVWLWFLTCVVSACGVSWFVMRPVLASMHRRGKTVLPMAVALSMLVAVLALLVWYMVSPSV